MTDLSRLGARSLGVWTRHQALALLTAGALDGFVRTGTWQVVWRGVYADGGVVLTPEQMAAAAVLAVGGAGRPRATTAERPTAAGPARPGSHGARRRPCPVASGRTAARVWGLPLIDDDDPATGACEHGLDDVTVACQLPRQAFRGRLLTVHLQTLRSDEVVRLPSGLWLTAPARTLHDCASLLSPEALVCAADAALHRHAVSPAQLHGAARAPTGRRGAPALRAAVALTDGRAESPAETLARLLLLPRLPGLEPQLLDRAVRLVARFDLADRAARLAVEADGKRGHAGSAMVAKDRRRDRASEAQGWWTERVTWCELRRERDAVVRRVLERRAQLQDGRLRVSAS